MPSLTNIDKLEKVAQAFYLITMLFKAEWFCDDQFVDKSWAKHDGVIVAPRRGWIFEVPRESLATDERILVGRPRAYPRPLYLGAYLASLLRRCAATWGAYAGSSRR